MMKTFLTISALSFWTLTFSQTRFIEGSPRLAYWEIGEGPEIVIALHGGPCVEHSYLRPEFDGLQKHAKVIFYDQRGCGESELSPVYNWQVHVRDLKRIIEQHGEGKKVFLAASSWGSALALLYAYTYPEDVKGMVLSGLFRWEGIGRKSDFVVDSTAPLENLVKAEIRPIWMKEHKLVKRKSEDGKKVVEKELIKKEVYFHSGPMSGKTRSSLATAPVFDSLAIIQTPVLLWNGSKPCGYLKAVDKYVDILPQATIRYVEGSCHDPWFANPEQFLKESNRFIKNPKRKRFRKKMPKGQTDNLAVLPA